MKKWGLVLLALLVMLLLIAGYVVFFQNSRIKTVATIHPIDSIESWKGDTYINGQKVDPNKNVIMQTDDALFISIDGLREYVSDRFIYERDGNWYIRQNLLESILIYQANGLDYLPLAFLEEYMRPDAHYFVRGIIQMHTYLPANVNWDGNAYTLTTETDTLPSKQHRSVTADGRRIWVIKNELWIESDDGLIYRYAEPMFTIN